MAGLMISAGWRSSGKTTVAVGLAAALSRRGLAVQAFKKGPDFIDPQWLSAATRRTCRNLDLRLQGDAGVLRYWREHGAGADVTLVEGNQGLHDGLAMDGSDSNAALARLLGLPVLLVLDAHGMGRNAAALLSGLAGFDARVRIAGVVLNRVGGARHEARLREAIEAHTSLKVLGALHEDARLSLVERHLGLVPANELADAQPQIAALADAVQARVDLQAVLDAARGAAVTPARAGAQSVAPAKAGAQLDPGLRRDDEKRRDDVVIGIARDRAFGFYYPDDLEALQSAGARLAFFDSISDARLPEVDGLYLGGGFPETLAERLEANAALRAGIAAAVEAGMPVYAECGGLMYLSRSVTYLGRTHRMVGAIPADAVMQARPVGKGYVTLGEAPGHPWGRGAGATIAAHEFHYSRLENVDPGVRYAYRVLRGHGIDGSRDGLVHRNVLASYAHLRSVGGNDWAARFVDFTRAHSIRTPAARSKQTLEVRS